MLNFIAISRQKFDAVLC